MRAHVTYHARQRMRERFPMLSDRDDRYFNAVLTAIALKGEHVADGYVQGEVVMKGLVRPTDQPIYIMCRPDRDNPDVRVVKTVLSEDELPNAGGVRREQVLPDFPNVKGPMR